MDCSVLFLCSFKCMASVLQELRSCCDDAITVVDIVSWQEYECVRTMSFNLILLPHASVVEVIESVPPVRVSVSPCSNRQMAWHTKIGRTICLVLDTVSLCMTLRVRGRYVNAKVFSFRLRKNKVCYKLEQCSCKILTEIWHKSWHKYNTCYDTI